MRAITDVFIKQPVLAIVVNVIIALVGLRAILSLPVQQFPQMENTSIIVTTVYIGATADTVRGFLTTPIERAVSSIAGVDYVQSQSIAGVSTVTVRLNLNHDATRGLAEVTARLQQVRSELPADAEPPRVEIQRADRPYASFYLSFYSDGMSLPELTDYLDREVRPQLATISGVQRVGVEGGQGLAMRVWIDPEKLASLGLTAGDVSEALARNNFLAAVGRAKSDTVQMDLLANTDLRNAGEFANLVVMERGDSVVRLRDVARIELGGEEAEMTAMHNGKEAVYLSVWPAIGVNEISLSHALREEMARLEPTLAPGVHMAMAYDATMFMENALKEISKTLLETVAIVGLVVFLFMGSIRTALVPLVAMPVSLVGAGVLMLAMGFSLNLLTILAIVLAVGLVVDDAIVVVENVERHVREGKTRLDAALVGARELVGPVIAMTITLAAVYAPLGIQGGLTGQLFREFAFTLTAAVIISGVVAVTLSPVMSMAMVREGGKQGALTRFVNGVFDRVRGVYSGVLSAAISLRWGLAVSTLVFALAAVPLYMFSRPELAPVEDERMINLFYEGSPDNTLSATKGHVTGLVDAMRSLEHYEQAWAIVMPSSGFGGIGVTDWHDRTTTTAEMMDRVNAIAGSIPGLRVYPGLQAPLPGAGQFDVQLVLRSGAPPEVLRPMVQQIIDEAMATGQFFFLDTDLKLDLPLARVEVDRERVADLGLDLASVGRELGTLLGGDYVNRFNFYDRSYKVIPQLAADDRATLGPLLDTKIRTPSGEMVPVRSFVRISTETTPRSLNRMQQQDAIEIRGGVPPGMKAAALDTLEQIAQRVTAGVATTDYLGESRQIRREGSSLLATLAFALVLIYLVLAAQFRSFRDPLVVLLGSVPLAISGALVFTFIDLTSINIYSQVGLITLVGLVAKNGILIVEFANHLQEQGRAKLDAVREAALTRLRPVLMTSAATVFGHLPLVFVTGPGAEARNSIGIILVAGMCIGTVFTLLVVPAFYVLVSRNHAKHATRAGTSENPGADAIHGAGHPQPALA